MKRELDSCQAVISNNFRLIHDLLDYSDKIEPGALIVFDFSKAFDNNWTLQALQAFGFGENFISTIKMTNSCILLYPIITIQSKGFSEHRSSRMPNLFFSL